MLTPCASDRHPLLVVLAVVRSEYFVMAAGVHWPQPVIRRLEACVFHPGWCGDRGTMPAIPPRGITLARMLLRVTLSPGFRTRHRSSACRRTAASHSDPSFL